MFFKTCRKCGIAKSIDEFYKHPQCADGHIGICKACKALYYQQNKDEKQGYQRTYWHANIPKNRHWRKTNAERIRARQQNYRKQHKQYVKLIEAVCKQRRKARKQSLPDQFSTSDWQRCLDYFGGRCAVCDRPTGLWHTLAADHWIPLSDPTCPGTVPTNIIPLCHGIDGCNNHKSNRDPIVWVKSKFGPRKAKQILKRINDYFAWAKTNP